MNGLDIDTKAFSVLYVDDDPALRDQAAMFLHRRVRQFQVVGNGQDALKLFDRRRPDIVITDIVMPKMNGLELARIVKRTDPDIPVIFTTGFDDTEYLLEAISLGADAFIPKPISYPLLDQALRKVAILLRNTRDIKARNARLSAYREHSEEERTLVAELMTKMMEQVSAHSKHLKYHLRQTEVVGGDLIAANQFRNKLYVMLADSTGHGLPAALNLLPINHIFYSMSKKGLPISMIVEEMNWGVKKQSPTGRFVAATIASIDHNNQVAEVWNGGNPPTLFISEAGEIQRSFDSVNLPLGILDRTFTADTEILQWQEAGQLLLYSDGWIEAENRHGEPYGRRKLEEIVTSAPPEDRFGRLLASMDEHLTGFHAHDDVSLLMVNALTYPETGRRSFPAAKQREGAHCRQ